MPQKRFCYLPETPDVKGTIEVDDEENFGHKITQEVTSTRIEDLRKDRVYHVHVMQNARPLLLRASSGSSSTCSCVRALS